MREKLKSCYSNFITDKYCWISCLYCLILFGLHHYQYIDSNHVIEPLIRMIYCFIYPFIIFFFGREAILFLFLIFGLTIEQFATFNNYTTFFIVVFFLAVYPKFTLATLSVYAIDVLVVCEHHDKSAIHFAIHFINCAFIWAASRIIFSICVKKIKKNLKKLDIDETDKYILSSLINGAHQKEIDGYSENTVSKRLKKMRERNYCRSNSELLQRYADENP